MELATRTTKTNDKPTSSGYIPYTQTTYGHLNRILAEHSTKSVALPPIKIFSCIPLVKDALGLRTPSVYKSHVNAAAFIMGKAVDPFKSVSKSTIDIQAWHKPTNQQ
jgi:hypothetical protein